MLKTGGAEESKVTYPGKATRRIRTLSNRDESSWAIANRSKEGNGNDNGQTMTMGDDKTRLQALSLINDCYKYIMDLTTNGVVIADAIKFVQTNREKITTMSTEEENNGKDQLEKEQEDEAGELSKQEITNQVF